MQSQESTLACMIDLSFAAWVWPKNLMRPETHSSTGSSLRQQEQALHWRALLTKCVLLAQTAG